MDIYVWNIMEGHVCVCVYVFLMKAKTMSVLD